jgi:hypothetical protein
VLAPPRYELDPENMLRVLPFTCKNASVLLDGCVV